MRYNPKETYSPPPYPLSPSSYLEANLPQEFQTQNKDRADAEYSLVIQKNKNRSIFIVGSVDLNDVRS